ncbi:LLM class flavin-dependent oxidoreductase [Kutzneria sp. CA-103260]|uniref:LLM class flavin-dependent oxidoreductase n=1 Tax=Kutzneria sp. CA-103260 TaxID=2802641 RepID=UPI001BA72C34|nr:LLM class flavin-dependent oxidoreductase [Kutzneria sp. CA-103260]QUQ67564.1 FMN-linked alkanal monooxygenase [Kutzneria sp. CA-103260]
MTRLSVLDTSPIVQGSTAREALRHTLDLALLAEELGFHRYWVPEHHGMRGVASSAPAVVVGRIAAATERIRVGAGGVLLPNHAPIVVAEQFGTLEAFHPGRIDLGLGRAPGGPQPAVDAVRSERERTAKSFEDQVRELLGYFRPGDDRVRAVPAVGNKPSVWLLGSSGHSAELAGSLGLGYAFAHHLRPDNAASALGRCRGAQTLVSVSVIVADTDAEAEYLAGSTRLKVLSRVRGRRIQLPSAADAAAYPYRDEDRQEIAVRSGGALVGSPDTVRPLLQAVVDETGTTELMLTTPVHDHAARRRSYELVSKIRP